MCIYCFSCSHTPIKETYSMFAMNTSIKITFYDVKDAKNIARNVEKIYLKYDSYAGDFDSYYGTLNVYAVNKNSKLKIGSCCSIAPEVIFLLSTDHRVNSMSTFPFNAICIGGEIEAISKGDIIIQDDVWIGYGAKIMSGVTIGQGAVIAAGAVVTKNVPPYAIVGGVPGKIIKYRFPEELISELIKIDYSKFDDHMIRKHLSDFEKEFVCAEQISWCPKKREDS